MATTYDGLSELVSMINTEWTSANTDNKTPNIAKITDYSKEIDFGDKKGYILLYYILKRDDVVGIGLTTKANVNETIAIDIRVVGDESYFNKISTELRRILYSKTINPTTNYDVLWNWDEITNKSNRVRKIFWEIRKIQLQAQNRSMTT